MTIAMKHESGTAVLHQQSSLRATKQVQLPLWIAQWNHLVLLLNMNPFMNQNQKLCSLTGAFDKIVSGSFFEPKLIMDTTCKMILFM